MEVAFVTALRFWSWRTEHFLARYNHYRPHGTLHGLTPAQYLATDHGLEPPPFSNVLNQDRRLTHLAYNGTHSLWQNGDQRQSALGRALEAQMVLSKNGWPCVLLVTAVPVLWATQALGAAMPCVGSDLTDARSALADANGTLDSLLNVRGSNSETDQLLEKWFGLNDASTKDSVVAAFDRSSNWMDEISFYCLYQNGRTLAEKLHSPNSLITVDRSGQVFAYVDPADVFKVYLGLAFFSAPPTGYDSKLGFVVHEMTHFWLTGNTDDIEYGMQDAFDLAKRDPAAALKNADNYECFVEEWLGH